MVFDEYEDLTDQELDAFYRPQKKNSRKSMLPLFVYLILREKSSAEKPMSQRDILQALEGMPYEIKVERKALSRTLHGMHDPMLGVIQDSRGRVYYSR